MSAIVLAAGQAAGEGGSNNFLLPNGTFFVVLVIFLIVLGVIGTFVVPPIMKVLREREYMVDKTLADNRRSDEQFAAARADYENAMAQARLEASAIRDSARAEGRKVLEEMRARAEEEVNATLQSASERLKQEGDAVAADLRSHVETMSATLARRILGVDIASAAPAGSER
ncbi:ATP synthase subunit b [Mycobacterium heckeshornense]|uniref:ATP synthase subunit b n=2 Tax=Mycobacterium heckeshornense TaxID=110505 RepID=A0A7R7TUA3_9MYCO|nr:ATP synthase subunit b [Mycobacterium heckeshornense]BCQ08275.1 ATP synthase subunit b [Mycobacterium heckeshornense]